MEPRSKICLVHDYLGAISQRSKLGSLAKHEVEVVEHLERDPERSRPQEGRWPQASERKADYHSVVKEMRRQYGRYAPDAFSALLQAHGHAEWARTMSSENRKFLGYLSETAAEQTRLLPVWALDPENWYHVRCERSSFELQSELSADFPWTVFDNAPIECLGNPEASFENIDEILQATGIYHSWHRGNLGQAGRVLVLDTGLTDDLASRFSVARSGVAHFTGTDQDGHGSAVTELILALAPQAKVQSVQVMNSYSDGRIWDLIAGLTRIYADPGWVVNASVGIVPDFARSLGASGSSLEEAITNVVASAAAQGTFVVSAAGNDGVGRLRWPAAAPEALAVGSHNSALELSSFSNSSKSALNFVLSPGGERRSAGQKVESFGRYGLGLSREIFGTSFSCAVGSGLSAVLQGYRWFQEMSVPSRISLFRNHCRASRDGYPLLNLADIGAVWPV